MANTNIGISNFVQTQSPFFVRNDHPNFIRFVEAYYEYMEQEGKTIQRAKGFKEALDVDRSIDLYTEKLYSQFLKFIPEETIADKNLIIKHIKDFYRARGTEKSVEFLMAILYDEDVNFYYPKRDILKASDGKWYQEKSLKVFDVQVNNVADPSIYTIKNLAGRQIRGETSNATATVESADVYYENGVIVKELKVSNQVRDFRAGEKIRGQFEEEGLIKDLSANVFSGIIVRVDIKNRGNNYSVGQIANVESNVGSGAVIVISEVSRAAIKSILAFDGGAGFQNTNLILISGSSGAGANAYVSLINADESVHPNTYNIVASLLGATANNLIGNTSNPYETFSYANLRPVLVTVAPNTSNLVANTISGTSVSQLYFNKTLANSNVYFKTGDSVNVYNTLISTNYVLYIASNTTVTDTATSNLVANARSGAWVNQLYFDKDIINSNVFFSTGNTINLYNVSTATGYNVYVLSNNTSSITFTPKIKSNLIFETVSVTNIPNTTNLIANSIYATSVVDEIYLNRSVLNSNVFFNIGDRLNVYNTQTSTGYDLFVTSNTRLYSNITVIPQIASNITFERVTVFKEPYSTITFTPQIPGNLSFERVEVWIAPFSAYSNLTISCGSGGSVSLINLSAWKANSNVFFETFDNIYCFGTNVTITQSNSVTSQLTVSPGLPGPLTNQPFQVIKKPNAYTSLANSMIYFTYANTGPISRVVVLAGGNNYTGNTTPTAVANTRVRNLGILGKMRIVSGGLGYALGEEIEIINQPWSPGVGASASTGSGARGYVASVNAGGTIESVKFKEVPGYIIGGTGYSQSRLPTANIISNTGVGGNVIVTAVLGDGETLTTVTDDLGAILKLDIISGGSGYATSPTINLMDIGSGTAQAVATIVEGVYTYPGRYLNDDGHLSSFNFLQDGKYYHNYSYVVRIKQSISKYRKALKDLVHPAGMSLFGEYTTVDDGETMNVQVSTARTTGNSVLKLSSFYTSSTLATYNTYTQNVIVLTADNHGLYTNDVIRIDFYTGDLANLPNRTYTTTVLSQNTFRVTTNTNPISNGTANIWLNNMSVYRANHGFGVGNNLYFEVVDSTTANITNGILTIVAVANSNTYNVVHTTIASSNGYNSGNAYIGYVS